MARTKLLYNSPRTGTLAMVVHRPRPSDGLYPVLFYSGEGKQTADVLYSREVLKRDLETSTARNLISFAGRL